MAMVRCEWANKDELYIRYHDEEWGVPLHDDRRLFELLILEGAQAGLSWQTILRKRLNYVRAFDGFEPGKIAEYDGEKVTRLLADDGIVRNRLKVRATIQNARAFLSLQGDFGSFDSFVWSFVGGSPKKNAWKRLQELPSKTPESEAMSRDLRKRGFSFVGPTVCYAFMQSAGVVNDHVVDCFRYNAVS